MGIAYRIQGQHLFVDPVQRTLAYDPAALEGDLRAIMEKYRLKELEVRALVDNPKPVDESGM